MTLARSRASARPSKPAPRLAVVAGTSTRDPAPDEVRRPWTAGSPAQHGAHGLHRGRGVQRRRRQRGPRVGVLEAEAGEHGHDRGSRVDAPIRRSLAHAGHRRRAGGLAEDALAGAPGRGRRPGSPSSLTLSMRPPDSSRACRARCRWPVARCGWPWPRSVDRRRRGRARAAPPPPPGSRASRGVVSTRPAARYSVKPRQ